MKPKGDQNQTNAPTPKFPFQRLFIEFLSIVLGVLLALALNEWRERRSHQSQAKAVLFNIKNELQSNLQALTALHENNVETVKLMSEDRNGDSSEERKFIPGLQLRQTA
jgi:hypothetical protein